MIREHNPDAVVTVSIDPDSLYEKMTYENLMVCASCRERKRRDPDFKITPGGWYWCPACEQPRKGIDLIEDSKLPKECPEKFRHLIAQAYGRESKNE
jgi:hypothetical protein